MKPPPTPAERLAFLERELATAMADIRRAEDAGRPDSARAADERRAALTREIAALRPVVYGAAFGRAHGPPPLPASITPSRPPAPGTPGASPTPFPATTAGRYATTEGGGGAGPAPVHVHVRRPSGMLRRVMEHTEAARRELAARAARGDPPPEETPRSDALTPVPDPLRMAAAMIVGYIRDESPGASRAAHEAYVLDILRDLHTPGGGE